jgi:threonine 3-dehydrogenase
MTRTMKAIVKTTAGPGGELRQVPVPAPGPGEVLVKVRAASICGTDLHIYAWNDWARSRIRPPLIFGHEVAGEVVATGEGVGAVRTGDFVSAETHVVCGSCHLCRTGRAHICQNLKILGVDIDGVFAEYTVLPAANVWPTDPSIAPDWASVQEPMGNAVHTVLAGDIVGRTVAIFGCGPIGLIGIGVALATGAERVFAVDVNPYRLDIARRMGAEVAIDAGREDPVQAMRGLVGPKGVDVFLEFSGAESALRQGFEILGYGGWASLLGLPDRPVTLDVTNGIVFKGATVYGIAGRRMFDTWFRTTALLRSRRVNLDPVITHRLPLEDFEKGFELMRSGQCGKVILYP